MVDCFILKVLLHTHVLNVFDHKLMGWLKNNNLVQNLAKYANIWALTRSVSSQWMLAIAVYVKTIFSEIILLNTCTVLWEGCC